MRIKTTQKLVSTDVKSNTANVKHTVACDVVPLCRDDLLIVDKRVSSGGGGGAGHLAQTLSNWHSSAGTGTATAKIEALQGELNTRRVQAGSQYAALESAVSYTTDLTAQYELGFNAVSDVNFSMETAHLAKNQILQQAATAMLAQANSGQQGLLQLIQG